MTGRILNIQKFSIQDGPGIRTTVFLKGCPLRCKWCANPESQNQYAHIADAMEDARFCGREYTVEEVMEEVLKDMPFYEQSGGGLTLSGGEVLQQMEFAVELAEKAKAAGIHVAVETTGYAPPKRFAAFLEHVDLFLYDVKHVDRDAHFAGTGVYNDVILENLQQLTAANKPVIVRIPVIPRFNTGQTVAVMMAEKLKNLGIREVHLLPFHQLGQSKYARLGIDYELEDVKQLHPDLLGKYRQVFLDAGLDCRFQ